MSPTKNSFAPAQGAGRGFQTTRWSVVLKAGRDSSPAAAAALEALCRAYWHPLYVFVRRQGHDPDAARDLTQEFFARLLAGHNLASVRREGGRFRSWLLTALRRFMVNEWHRIRAAKRGGGQAIVPLDTMQAEERCPPGLTDAATPEVIYERCWAEALLDQVVTRLNEEYSGHALGWVNLAPLLLEARSDGSMVATAVRLGVTEAAFRAVVHRMRRRYRQLFEEEVAHTVGPAGEVEAEMRHVLRIISRSLPDRP